MDGACSAPVLRRRSERAAVAPDCAALALPCAENSRREQPRHEGTRCALVWTGARGRGKLAALIPFGAPALYQGLPLVALRSCTPLLRLGWEQAALHALLDWFRADGEGAALLEFRGLARGGPGARAGVPGASAGGAGSGPRPPRPPAGASSWSRRPGPPMTRARCSSPTASG